MLKCDYDMLPGGYNFGLLVANCQYAYANNKNAANNNGNIFYLMNTNKFHELILTIVMENIVGRFISVRLELI